MAARVPVLRDRPLTPGSTSCCTRCGRVSLGVFDGTIFSAFRYPLCVRQKLFRSARATWGGGNSAKHNGGFQCVLIECAVNQGQAKLKEK